jgi:predicted Fe-S protein YdhL (DUF1289 family)
MEEIRAWYKNTDEEKLKTIAKADNRRAEYDKKLPYI